MKRESSKQLLLKHELSFGLFMGRLKTALGFETDSELAQALGMSTGNYANRKRAESIPFEMAIPLARSHSVSIDWLCSGIGPTYIDGRPSPSVPFAQVDSLLMGTVVRELERASAGADAKAASSSMATAHKIGTVAALIYNQAVAESDDARRLEKIRDASDLIMRVERLAPTDRRPTTTEQGDTSVSMGQVGAEGAGPVARARSKPKAAHRQKG